jgi:hypothetical protein
MRKIFHKITGNETYSKYTAIYMAKYILQKSGKKSENEYVKGEKKNEEIKS